MHSRYRNTQLPPKLQITQMIQMSTVITAIPTFHQLQITLNNTIEHNHYSNTQLPPQLQITLYDTNEHSHYSNTQLPATVRALKNTKEHILQEYPASTIVTNNTK